MCLNVFFLVPMYLISYQNQNDSIGWLCRPEHNFFHPMTDNGNLASI